MEAMAVASVRLVSQRSRCGLEGKTRLDSASYYYYYYYYVIAVGVESLKIWLVTQQIALEIHMYCI